MVIIIISIVVVIFIAFTIFLWIFTGELFFMAPSSNKMDRFLKTNIDKLSYVADALFDLDYEGVTIHRLPQRVGDKYNLTMEVIRYKFYEDGSRGTDIETIPITGELLDHIVALYESGVRVISCGRDSVGFSVWAFMGEIRGIKYTKNGKIPDGEQLIDVMQLSKENWYYYIHNYEKAKVRNPELFQ